MDDHIFRLYDIRGKFGSEWCIEEVYTLAKALAYYFVQKNPNVKTIALGADGRVHSPHIKNEVVRALRDSGLDVIYVGTCPSPVVYFSLFNLPVDAGLMITASHNGKEYNGIKICLGKESVWGEQIQEIKKLFHARAAVETTVYGAYREYDAIEDYVQWLYNNFPHLHAMQLSAVIDCGNGAAGTVLPRLIKKMQWEHVELLFPEVDGTYPNHEADPIVEENMQAVKNAVLTTAVEVGLGLDGDCDRMTPMTKTGELVQGDKLLALFAHSIIECNPGATIVFDIKCSSGLEELLRTWGANPCISPSGHSIIKNQMKKNNALLAGELSCHFFFHDRYFGYDDGIYAALRLFEILLRTGKTLHELLMIFPKKVSTPEIRIACNQDQMDGVVKKVHAFFAARSDCKILTIDGIRVIKDYGWGMLRSSNTQPVLCLRFESDSLQGLHDVKQDFLEALQLHFEPSWLKNQLSL